MSSPLFKRAAGRLLLILALLTALLPALLVSPAQAQTVSRPAYSPVWLKSHKVSIDIDNQVAVTKIDQVLANSSNRDQEVVYLFPVPARAAISDFTMYVDGQRLEAQILDQGQARGIYEQIVRTQRDPALLEYAGQGVVKVSIYPVPANGQKRIQIQYNQVLKAENGLAEYDYPFSLPQFSNRPVEDLSLNLKLRSKDGLKALYSPSHSVSITRNGANEAEITYEEHNSTPARDFRFLYGAGDGDFSLNFLTYQDPADHNSGNYFMLLVTPKVTDKLDVKQVVAKDVFLVLDTSGSMEGEKVSQARRALLSVLGDLNPQDRFNVITFESYVKTFSDHLVTMDRRSDAQNWVNRIQAGGGTNINDALQTALNQAQADHQANRPQTIIFLTDGLPTSGETDQGRILANTKKAASQDVRLFSFGVGYDVNTALLDNLASQNQGISDYVKPNEDVEEKVSRLYSRISQPVLTNLSLEFSDITIDDYYPRPVSDVFYGSQLVLTGRFYAKNGSSLPKQTSVTLKGYANGQPVSFKYDNLQVSGGDNADSNSYIPRLWAGRRVGNLLTQIQANPNSSSNKELIDEVTRLSVRYGIITPYTSFLVREPTPAQVPVPMPDNGGFNGSGSASGGTMAAMTTAAATTAAAIAPADARYQATAAATVASAANNAPASGAGAVNNSQQTGNLANSNIAPTAVAMKDGSASLKYAADKTFVLTNGIWTDTIYDGKAAPTKVVFGSEAYFALLQKKSQWSQYFAVGNELLVVLDGQPYRVTMEGASADTGTATTPANKVTGSTPTPASGSVTTPAASVVAAVQPSPAASTGSTTGATTTATPVSDNGWLWPVALVIALLLASGAWLVMRRRTSAKK